MRRILFCLSILTILGMWNSEEVKAQDNYKTAVGVRLGSPSGITYKQFLGRSNNAIEIIAGMSSFKPENLSLNVLYEYNKSILGNSGLAVFFGVGGHIGTFRNDFRLGADGIAGFEFTFRDAPINMSFDFKPIVFFGSFGVKPRVEGGLSLRYTLSK